MVDTKMGTLRAGAVAGVHVNRTGRRTYSDAYKLEVVRQCSGPGVSVAAVALSHGLNANLVRRWMVRGKCGLAESTAKPQATMLPVTIEATTLISEDAAGAAVGASARQTSPSAAAIEIELYGARIHLRGGVDARVLRCVLDVLAQR